MSADWIVGADGWLEGIRAVASPNCDDRPEGAAAQLVMLHGISLPPGQFGGDAIERLFTNRLDANAHPALSGLVDLRVSAHFVVHRDGGLVQYVPVTRRAWHAGASSWRGRMRCNDFSVGIELEGTDEQPYAAAQYRALAALVRVLAQALALRACAGHSDVAPGRKTDPGPAFDWHRFHQLLLAD